MQEIRQGKRMLGAKKGQSLVLFALMTAAIFGMLALAIDAGFLWGQRRFMQNGADSAALAAATLLGNNVANYPTPPGPPGPVPVYFLTSDAEVRSLVNQYVQRNQNAGLASRTTETAFDLFYFASTDGAYNGDLEDLENNAWISSPTEDGRVPDGTYRVRVTPRSTVQNLFAVLMGRGESEAGATAVAGIYGEDIPSSAPGQLIPLTAWDHRQSTDDPPFDFGQVPDQVVRLWGSTVEWDPDGDGKDEPVNDFKNVLDLSHTPAWRDAVDANYKFIDESLSPPPEGQNSNLAGVGQWNRQGFTADPRHAGTVNSFPDAPWWTGNFFGGVVHVGNNMPVYTNAKPDQSGDLGQNVAMGIWGVNPPWTPHPDIGDCLFCDESKLYWDLKYSGEPYNWGPYRPVLIALWNNPEWWAQDPHTKEWSWVRWDDEDLKALGAPSRVEITQFHVFKIFRDKGTAKSEVWGQWTSATLPPGGGNNPPSSWFNSVRLVE